MKRELARIGSVASVLLTLFIGRSLLYAAEKTPSLAGTTWQRKNSKWTFVFEKDGGFKSNYPPSREPEIQDGRGHWSQRGDTVEFDFKTRCEGPDWAYTRHYRFRGKLEGNQMVVTSVARLRR